MFFLALSHIFKKFYFTIALHFSIGLRTEWRVELIWADPIWRHPSIQTCQNRTVPLTHPTRKLRESFMKIFFVHSRKTRVSHWMDRSRIIVYNLRFKTMRVFFIKMYQRHAFPQGFVFPLKHDQEAEVDLFPVHAPLPVWPVYCFWASFWLSPCWFRFLFSSWHFCYWLWDFQPLHHLKCQDFWVFTKFLS